ncbi:MAG: hypothetical protein QF448_07815, partial [Candidatus Thalassarchaeaceae archaeon]|nr:hypothetical protein [Candidatus Thalassarchaeaceae archaeon]
MALRAHQPSAVILGVSLLGLTLASCGSSGVSTAPDAPSETRATLNKLVDANLVLLATTRTSTMQREMQEVADAGYSLAGLQGGKTGGGFWELVVVM